MHQNTVWLAFLGLLGLVTLYFSTAAIQEVNHFRHLYAEAPAQVTNWQVVQRGSSKYVLAPTFRFIYQKKTIEVSEVWELDLHRNRWSAEQEIEAMKKQSLTAFFNPQQPQEASLKHVFPWKSVISAGALIALLCYFIGLGYYVGKMAV